MSSDRATLAESLSSAQRAEERAQTNPESEPASGEESQSAAWTPTEDPDEGRRCRNCGSHVTADWVRVFGGSGGRVWACLDCASHAEMRDGAGASPDHEWRVDR